MNYLKFRTSAVFLLFIAIVRCNNIIGKQSHELLGAHNYTHCSDDRGCPTWFICNSSNVCQCGNEHDQTVICDNRYFSSAVLVCNCVTYDKESRSTYLGSCFYNCDNHQVFSGVYEVLPDTSETLINESICTDFNRAGLLCGDCKEGYSPLVLSYNLSCVRCPDGHKNWWKFILVGFMPLTFFYFFVVIFNINVTTSRLHGAVWFSQIVTVPALVRVMFLAVQSKYPNYFTVVRVFTLFYDFWNLNLLRSVIPDICLNVTTLQSIALDYLIALYPFALGSFSYFVIKLYDSKIYFIVMLWRPFRALLANFRETMDVRTSVIDSFATFFLLSSIKISSVTADLLVPTQIYRLGSNTSDFTYYGLYYSPTVAYFGEEHLPYAILAIFISTVFFCVPTILLILYPFQFFQRFLSLFPYNWHYLRAFVDSVQGCYKDGTEPGTFDCRWFSALTLLLRLSLFPIFTLTLSMMYFVYAVVAVLAYVIVAINLQPYKKSTVHYPSTDSTFMILLCICFIANIGRDTASREIHLYYSTITALVILSAIIPVLYIALLITYWLITKVKWIHQLLNE